MYELKTRNQHNMFDISSMIQKSLRRGLVEHALYAAVEMAGKYRSYLWKRLFVVSAEDCNDLVTGRVLSLYERDKRKADDNAIAEAVCLLAATRKNRDADYFACNILNSRDRRELRIAESHEATTQYPTKNGHDLYDTVEVMKRAFEDLDIEGIGYTANEIGVRYKKYLWNVLLSEYSGKCSPNLAMELNSLKKVDFEQIGEKNETPLYLAKGIVLLLKEWKGYDLIDMRNAKVETRPLDSGPRHMRVPDYVYDCHTVIGRKRGKTKRQFVVEEQASLRPFVKGMFDGCSWERFFELCDTGFWDKENWTPPPAKEKREELENPCRQLDLFGM